MTEQVLSTKPSCIRNAITPTGKEDFVLSNKINILYINDYLYARGGTERHLLYLLKLLNSERYNCCVVAFDMGDTKFVDEINAIGVPVIHIPVGRYYTLNAVKRAFELRGVIKSRKIDIVQTFHFKSDFYGAVVAYLSGVKYIISSKRDVGDLKSDLHFFLTKLVRRITKRYIVVAKAVGEVVKKREGVPVDKMEVIYNGVDLNIFRSPDAAERHKSKAKLGLSESDFVVGTVAMMRPEKNHDVLLQSFEQALTIINGIKLVIVGGGPLFEFYNNYVQQKGLDKHVILTGPVDDVRLYLRAFDVACLIPGGNEGFSNSIIEKMAMGLPLVVTDVGGNAEAVVDGYNGFVIPPDNSDRLTEALEYLANHSEERKEMGAKSAQRVRNLFTLEGMVTAHEKLYESIIVS